MKEGNLKITVMKRSGTIANHTSREVRSISRIDMASISNIIIIKKTTSTNTPSMAVTHMWLTQANSSAKATPRSPTPQVTNTKQAKQKVRRRLKIILQPAPSMPSNRRISSQAQLAK
jgi:carbohydrate-binding DOMON domain-containing protein